MNNTNIPVTRVHSYNVSVAADVGINAAVIFYNICFWVEENAANERNFVNGEYWTYNTVSAFQTIFPEMSYEQIRNAIRKLENKNYIKSAYLSDDTMDRTKWYTVVDAERWCNITKCNCENYQMENAKSTDDNIYNIYNNTNTDNKQETDNNNTDNSHKYAYSKQVGKAGDMYASFSAQKEEVHHAQSRYIPPDYTEEQLIKHIYPVIKQRIASYGFEEERQADAVIDIAKIIILFHRDYYERFGRKHKILSDKAYERIVDEFLFPPEGLRETNAVIEAYSAMMEQYFDTEYNKQGKRKGRVELSLSHFMSKNIREHLFYRTCY